MYYKEILGAGNFGNLLTDSEINELVMQGTTTSINAIVEHNLGLVKAIVSRGFSWYDCDSDDLFQIGCIGLIKAARTFNLSKKNKFSTYASRCIENEIRMFIRKDKKKPK